MDIGDAGILSYVCLMESYPWKMKGCLRLTLDGSHYVRDHNLMQVYAGFFFPLLSEASILNYAETTVLQDWISHYFFIPVSLTEKAGTVHASIIAWWKSYPWATFEKKLWLMFSYRCLPWVKHRTFVELYISQWWTFHL